MAEGNEAGSVITDEARVKRMKVAGPISVVRGKSSLQYCACTLPNCPMLISQIQKNLELV